MECQEHKNQIFISFSHLRTIFAGCNLLRLSHLKSRRKQVQLYYAPLNTNYSVSVYNQLISIISKVILGWSKLNFFFIIRMIHAIPRVGNKLNWKSSTNREFSNSHHIQICPCNWQNLSRSSHHCFHLDISKDALDLS